MNSISDNSQVIASIDANPEGNLEHLNFVCLVMGSVVSIGALRDRSSV